MSALPNANEALGAGDIAPDLTLTSDEGQPVYLSGLWRERPLVLLFVRHFG